MDLAKNMKCIITLLKTLKIVTCVKKIEICVIIGVIVLMVISSVCGERKTIAKTIKQLKKKVM